MNRTQGGPTPTAKRKGGAAPPPKGLRIAEFGRAPEAGSGQGLYAATDVLTQPRLVTGHCRVQGQSKGGAHGGKAERRLRKGERGAQSLLVRGSRLTAVLTPVACRLPALRRKDLLGRRYG